VDIAEHDELWPARAMKPDFWRHRRILITGHTGFKGSWLSLWLQSVGAVVVGYGLEPPTRPSLFELARVADGMTCITGDVRDEDHLRRVMERHRPEVVIHLAAQALVRESYRDPVETFATNVMGTVNLLEAVRHATGVRAVVCVTSDKCYENREWLWGYREYEAMGGFDPYSSSKGCAELVANAYRNSFLGRQRDPDIRIGLATARAGNVIGGGDWAKDRLVPDAIRSLAWGEEVVIRNPRSIRPWQHVLDPLNGYLVLAEHLYADGPRYAESWNFGPPESNSRSVEWIVEYLQSLWGANASWQLDERSQPHEDTQLRLDSSKARLRLNWQARLELRTALEWVVEWTHAFLASADMRDVSELQIRRFMQIRPSESVGEPLRVGGRPLVTPLSVEQQAQLLEHAPDGIMVRRVDGTITYWNHRAEQLYGWKKEEAIGSISHALLQTQFPTSLDEIENQLLSNGYWHGALVHTTRRGERIDVSSYWAVQPQKKTNAAVLEVNRVGVPAG
jgi:CDP-glucose 4,6-dehydratase